MQLITFAEHVLRQSEPPLTDWARFRDLAGAVLRRHVHMIVLRGQGVESNIVMPVPKITGLQQESAVAETE